MLFILSLNASQHMVSTQLSLYSITNCFTSRYQLDLAFSVWKSFQSHSDLRPSSSHYLRTDWKQLHHADPPSVANLLRKDSISEFTLSASSCWTKWCPSMIETSRSGTFSFKPPLLTYSSVPKDCRPTSFLLSMNFAGTVIFDPLQGAVSLQFLQRPYIYIYIYTSLQ